MRYAGFWRRLAAHLLDTIVLNLAAWGLGEALFGAMYGVYWVIARTQGQPLRSYAQAFDPVFEQVVSVVVYLALAFLYFVWAVVRYGTTLGKRPLRVYVVRERDGSAIGYREAMLRYVGYLPSYVVVGCGFLMVAFHPQKRGLHDLIAGTVSVIKER